ncbi:unnamed protein product [Cuscuta campestris]|uniref:F-box domain-containing protein n=1 Tax=Cuscuta campestris TaxID=132261 RepID=A0A484LN66_9ASTE|nr:unnamed protein product [Cuscuta campestris]
MLPPELIEEILTRLPVKSLLKFRCVSKSWLALISTPEFINTHLTMSHSNEDYAHHRLLFGTNQPNIFLRCSINSFFYAPFISPSILDYPMRYHESCVCIMGSVNGLICFCAGWEDFIVWNPSIRKFKTFTDFKSRYCSVYGFGYDKLRDDYKLFIVREEAEIYSVNNESWTTIADFPTPALNIKGQGVLLNGKLHWSQNRHSYNGWGIVWIDLTDDGMWGNVQVPCYGEGNFDYTSCVGVLGSYLAVFCIHNPGTLTDVWVMREYGVHESWEKIFTFNLLNLHNRPSGPTGYEFSSLLCRSVTSEILFLFGSAFVIFDPRDDSIRHRHVFHHHILSDASIYIESLVWPFLSEDSWTKQIQQIPDSFIYESWCPSLARKSS